MCHVVPCLGEATLKGLKHPGLAALLGLPLARKVAASDMCTGGTRMSCELRRDRPVWSVMYRGVKHGRGKSVR